MDSKSLMTNRNQFFQRTVFKLGFRLKFVLALACALAAIASFQLWPEAGVQASTSATAGEAAAFPTLQGKAAVEHLKRQGLDTPLGAALRSVSSAPYAELTRLEASDGANYDEFGWSVAVSGNTVVIGEPFDDVGLFGTDQGSVYVFVRSGSAMLFQAKLTAGDGSSNDYFGWAVAIKDNTVVVGARNGVGGRGAAYVFTRILTTWGEQQKLTAGDGAPGDFLGSAVAIGINTVVVGAFREGIGNNLYQGSAYIFVRSGSTWGYQQKLTAVDGAAGDEFGWDVSISGNTIVVGAVSDRVNGNYNQGSAYVFVRSGTTWSQQQKLTAPDGTTYSLFGSAVAVSGDTAAISSPGDNDNAGAVYIFTRSGTSWTQQQKLVGNDVGANWQFGNKVALNETGDAMIVGDNNSPADNLKGAAYLFQRSGSAWTQQKLTASTNVPNQAFGQGVGISGTTVVCGAPKYSFSTGTAYVFTPPPNSPPTITASQNVSLPMGSTGTTITIAAVGDAEDPESGLQVAVEGGASAQLGPVIISNLSVEANGFVKATIETLCAPDASAAIFNLSVTDSNGASALAPLAVGLTPNTAPALAYGSPQMVNPGGAKTINPSSGPGDDGAIASIVVQSVVPAFGGSITVNQAGVVSVSNAGPAGNYTVTVRATDHCGAATNATFTLAVASNCPAVTVSPGLLPNSFVGQAYNATLTAAGGVPAYSFALVGGALPGGVMLASNGILTGTLTAAGTFNFTVQAADANGCTGTRGYTMTVNPVISPVTGMQFYPLPRPVRLVDTRAGQGNCDSVGAPIAAGTSLTMLARATCEGITIPSTAKAVVGNLTAINQSAQAGYLTVYPDGQAAPLASNMIYSPGQILANNFTVGLSSDGKFNVFGERTIDVVIDISGYYAPPGAGGLYYHPLSKPVRLLDTRPGQGNCDSVSAPIAAGTALTTQAWTTCEGLTLPPTARAIAANATVVNGSGQTGYLTIYPSGGPVPLASNMVYFPGQIISNAFTTSLSANGEFDIYGERTVDMIVDVAGYYSAEATDANGPGLLFNSLTRPLRILDTRAGQGNCDNVSTPITGGTSIVSAGRLTCEGITIPPAAQSLLGNVTVINQTSQAGYLTLYADGVSAPLASNLVYFPGQLLANAFVVGLDGGTGQFRIFAERRLDAVVDVSGYFAP